MKHYTQKGFTIVELLLAVVIIGILAAALSPIYEKYMAKARAMEGPILLSQLYSAEREIFMETGTYVACVFALGIETEEKGYFVSGFNPLWNVGKAATRVPNCAYHGTQTMSTCNTSSGRLAECTATNTVATSDFMVIPPILLKRGSPNCAPYPDLSLGTQTAGQPCGTSSLTDAANVPGTQTSKDVHFTACALGCISNSDSFIWPTEYTINEKKKISLKNQSW